jgi:hypothetical protein
LSPTATSNNLKLPVLPPTPVSPWWHRQAWWQLLVTGSLLMLLASFPFLWMGNLPVCAFRWLTGQLCPLCGLTHGLAALLHGDGRGAWQSNPLSFLAMAMLLYGFTQAVAGVLFPECNVRLLPARFRQQVPRLLLLLLILVGVARWK